jgi:hypothetical protein
LIEFNLFVHSVGVTFVRWGKKTCLRGKELVYSGIAAGPYFGESGGGSITQCLPADPQWDKYVDGLQSNSYIYGTEYEVQSGLNPFSDQNLQNANVPCAVCYAKGQHAQIMIPALTKCPRPWKTEYGGYLMSQRYNFAGRSSYLCVDMNAEAANEGNKDENGNLIYVVESVCGSLPCPNYYNGRELACVVCTR